MSSADRKRAGGKFRQMRCLAALGEWERLIALLKRGPTNEGGATHSHASKIGIQVGENGGRHRREKVKKLVSAKHSVSR